VTLARPSDFELLPAWLGHDTGGNDPWSAVTGHLAGAEGADAVERARLLGLAAAVVGSGDDAPVSPWVVNGSVPRPVPKPACSAPAAVPRSRPVVRRRAPLVVDLSALWAGPLCTNLLSMAGARVVKVESPSRPDGSRRGPPAFFDLLNADKQSVVVDPERPDGRAALHQLLDASDVIVESARPRVMRQWGIDVEDVVARRTDVLWLSLTGYGRAGPGQQWVAFGDDAAAGAGAIATGTDGAPRFCADAYADPVAGLHGAVVALAGWIGGGAHLIDLPLARVCAHLLVGAESGREQPPGRVVQDGETWRAEAAGRAVAVAPPQARHTVRAGPPLGAHTQAVLSELARA
jgi:crotonobetainyl-CoA:carnitine CoA-transferase CaiB-like acyl-CoA transferase